MLWAMFCWETLGPAIHVDVNLTRVTSLNIVADQIHPFMAMVFPDGCGLFQQDNAPCPTAHIVQQWLKEHDAGLQILQISIRLSICGICWTDKSDPRRLHLTTYRT